MRIMRPRRRQRRMIDVLPRPAIELHALDSLQLNCRPLLPDIRQQREQKPLSHERDLELCRDDGQQDAHGMRAGQQMQEEEVVLLAGLVRRDDERRGGFLGGRELCFRVRRHLPCVPVVEEDVFACLQDARVLVGAFVGADGVEARVVGDVLQDGERRGGRVAAWARVRWVVEILVQGVVEACSEAEGFDGHVLRVELVGVAEMDERVGYCGRGLAVDLAGQRGVV